MKCEDVQQNFPHLMADKINIELAERIQTHLETCENCRDEFSADKQIAEIFLTQNDIPALSFDFNKKVLERAETARQPVWKKATAFFVERPAASIAASLVFSVLMLLNLPDNLSSNGWGEMFLIFFTSKPVIAALVLAATGWVYYVNEKFLEKLAGKNERQNAG